MPFYHFDERIKVLDQLNITLHVKKQKKRQVTGNKRFRNPNNIDTLHPCRTPDLNIWSPEWRSAGSGRIYRMQSYITAAWLSWGLGTPTHRATTQMVVHDSDQLGRTRCALLRPLRKFSFAAVQSCLAGNPDFLLLCYNMSFNTSWGIPRTRWEM